MSCLRAEQRPGPRSGQGQGQGNRGWQARLELELAPRDGRTRISSCRHEGPLLVQRTFHPDESGTAHVYLLHPPGGIAGGDRLEISIRASAGARALLTTPAATKVYRCCAGRESEQSTTLRVGAGASLDWLPQETIVFDGARSRARTRVELEPGARFAGWEITCLGRPGAGESFRSGHWLARLEVLRGARPLLRERLALAGGDAALERPWGLSGFAVAGTLVASSELGAAAQQALVASLRAALGRHAERHSGELWSASALDGIAVCRYLGNSTARARAAFTSAWEVLRSSASGPLCAPPRIWAT